MATGQRIRISFSRATTELLQELAAQLHAPESIPADTAAERIYTCIKSVEAASNRISTWSLSVVGATFLAIFSREYIKIEAGKIIYLLFVLSWMAIGISIYQGKKVLGYSLGAELWRNTTETLVKNFMDCNRHFGRQLRYFNIGLLILGIWLLAFLVLWVFDINIIAHLQKHITYV